MKTKTKKHEVLKVLYVEDSQKDTEILHEMLTDAGYEINMDCTDKEKEFVSLLKSKKYDLILSDFRLPGFDGFTALRWAMEICPHVPFICVSGTIGEDVAVELLKKGAVDYVLKDRMEKLPIVIERALEEVKEKEARMQAEEKLRFQAQIIDQVHDGIVTTDQKGIIVLFNKGAERLLGYSGEEASGKPISFVFPKDQLSVLTEEIQLQVRMGGWHETDVQFRNKSGEEIPVHLTLTPLNDFTGNVVGIIWSAKDITERKRAVEALLNEQYLTETFMENVPDRIYFKDRESRFIRISKAQARLFSLNDPSEANGKTDYDFFSEEHAHQAYEDEQEIIRTGQPISKEEKETWPDRPETWVYSTKLPLRDKEGNIIGTFGISIDITARKEIELLLIQKNRQIETQNQEFLALNDELSQTNTELLLANEKAEENDSLKTAFLQNISHEIRTPMNGILGFAELMKNHKMPDFKRQEFIRLIEESGLRMLNIINDIVNISKIETGQIEIELKETNVNLMVLSLHNFFKHEAEGKGLDLIFKTGLSDELSKIKIDDTKLTQVLSNLIKNALKFTNSGSVEFGYNIVETLHVTSLQFYVQDTGIGINPDQQSIIFEKFRKVDMSVERNIEGAGLGLTISKAFVEKLGGNIWVKSELGTGSTFFFNIPYSSSDTNQSEKLLETETVGKLQHVNILIVEDDEICMQLLKEMLEIEEAILFFANNGKEAVDIVKTKPEIQIVLMDLKMPIMDGFEATKLIKKTNPGLPVIAQSAYTFSNDQDKARIAGCDAFIGKPIKRELLLSIITTQLHRSIKPKLINKNEQS